MVYQAMFDEVDEGTAIFKCTNDVPVGESKFADFEGLPSDFYLKLVGKWTHEFRMAKHWATIQPAIPQPFLSLHRQLSRPTRAGHGQARRAGHRVSRPIGSS